MWMRHAEAMLRSGRVRLAADGLARALDGAINRTHPRLVDRHDRRLSRDEPMREFRRRSLGGPGPPSQERLALAIEGLSDWVVPLALGLPPSGYAATRAAIGYESRMDTSGAPVPVDRPKEEPTADDVRRAAGTVSVMIFELWATGTLVAGRRDEEAIRLAQPFLADPCGTAAGERASSPVGLRNPDSRSYHPGTIGRCGLSCTSWPAPSLGLQVQSVVRHGAPLGGDAGHPHALPSTECECPCRARDRDDPGRVPRLDPHPRSTPARPDAPHLRRALQPRAAPSCPRSGVTTARGSRPDPCQSARRSPPGPARRPHPRVPRRRGVIESRFPIPTGPPRRTNIPPYPHPPSA